jgi:hypothetical protein
MTHLQQLTPEQGDGYPINSNEQLLGAGYLLSTSVVETTIIGC